MSSALKSLIYARAGESFRCSSWDRTGGNGDAISIPAGQEAVIFDQDGPAQINHIWFTISCGQEFYLRRLILRMYWDGEENPSVECPVGDFFGVGHGVANHYVSLPLNMITRQGEPQSFAAMNCFFTMPFQKHGKITIVNECDVEVDAFYFYVDYESVPNFAEPPLYFHATWHRQNPTDGIYDMEELKSQLTEFTSALRTVSRTKNLDGKGNYVILEAEGMGHFVGCNLSIDHINPVPNVTWFGEGDDMVFIDGEPWPPRLHGTGTEDYFCAAWDYPSLKYDGPYHGISLAQPYLTPKIWETPGAWGGGSFGYSGKWTTYRFHIEDPIIFKKSIRFTIEHGHANSLSNDYASTAYWYQTEPHKNFEPMLPVEKRLPLTNKESLSRYCKSI
ncbi:MAG: glycoside hydrolase family 172 protein [Candidatus Merdivicinus sp.]|jgi:hypothetical protein